MLTVAGPQARTTLAEMFCSKANGPAAGERQNQVSDMAWLSRLALAHTSGGGFVNRFNQKGVSRRPAP